MIQSNKDLYHEINDIINILKVSGNENYAKKLENALSISTVPSEILGETRLVLLTLKSTTIPEALNLKTAINSSLNYLNRIL